MTECPVGAQKFLRKVPRTHEMLTVRVIVWVSVIVRIWV